MRLGNSICLIAFGAALTFAVNAPSDRIDIGMIGVIVMVVGIVSLFLSPSDWDRPASWTTLRALTQRPPVDEPPLAPEPPTYSTLRVVEHPATPERPRRVS